MGSLAHALPGVDCVCENLMLAATAGVLPDATWLYFALAQFPIYITPQLLRPLARAKPA